MSGPIETADVPNDADIRPCAEAPTMEITPSRVARVDGQAVRRALPYRGRRTVGAWCFADHMGPSMVDGGPGLGIGPHPHIGLQTVTWLVSGEVLHRDSLGSEQLIRPGQLNLMTAGSGVAHAEESPTNFRGELHGIQLWVAQPERTRHGAPAFEHHAELPRVDFGNAEATVLVGDFGGTVSPARRDTEHVGVDLVLSPGRRALPLESDYEYAMVVLDGAVTVNNETLTPGHLGYLGLHRQELPLVTTEATRLLLLGGLPFESPVLMWWNFVGRTREEIESAAQSWQSQDGRFPAVNTELQRISAPPIPWRTAG